MVRVKVFSSVNTERKRRGKAREAKQRPETKGASNERAGDDRPEIGRWIRDRKRSGYGRIFVRVSTTKWYAIREESK